MDCCRNPSNRTRTGKHSYNRPEDSVTLIIEDTGTGISSSFGKNIRSILRLVLVAQDWDCLWFNKLSKHTMQDRGGKYGCVGTSMDMLYSQCIIIDRGTMDNQITSTVVDDELSMRELLAILFKQMAMLFKLLRCFVCATNNY